MRHIYSVEHVYFFYVRICGSHLMTVKTVLMDYFFFSTEKMSQNRRLLDGILMVSLCQRENILWTQSPIRPRAGASIKEGRIRRHHVAYARLCFLNIWFKAKWALGATEWITIPAKHISAAPGYPKYLEQHNSRQIQKNTHAQINLLKRR